ncbi:WecB/TagA/CpsF family glycosyltransferase [Candidatus Daviesbacteria bacterium]|nr:WecB/TagA/CpsF family glycosyltransferase [Candidatus Daviesbacteria bacterium]
MKVQVLGVKIDDISMPEALMVVEKWVWSPGKHYIVTPNPEMIVAAQKDEIFKEVLNSADLSIPDGVGLKLSGKVKNTFAGVDFMEQLVKAATEKGFTTSFLGGREGVAEKCAERLKKKYPGLKVVFAESGGEVDKDGNMRIGDNSLPPCDLLFVAFGHQKQEKWIAKNLNKIPAHVIMGVGGSFDYLSGKVLRPPKVLRSLGLEWLFRLILEPWRIKRQVSLIKYLWFLASG